jgi:hypothetical protein
MLAAGAVAAGAVPGVHPVLFGTTLGAGPEAYALNTPLGPFVALTVAASAVWCFAVSAAGWIAGRSYEQLGHALRYADIVAVAVALIAWLVVRGRLRAAAP